MFRPQAQAETHSKAQGPLHASRTTQAETHSNRRGSPLASASGTYFFLFINRLQAQAHRDPGSMPLSSRALCVKFYFFYF